MTNSTDRKKVANIYLDANTHETIKRLAAYQSTSMQTFIASWLDETQPVMQEMITAFEKIKSGENATEVLNNMVAKGLKIANDANDDLIKEDKEDATDNRQSD